MVKTKKSGFIIAGVGVSYETPANDGSWLDEMSLSIKNTGHYDFTVGGTIMCFDNINLRPDGFAQPDVSVLFSTDVNFVSPGETKKNVFSLSRKGNIAEDSWAFGRAFTCEIQITHADPSRRLNSEKIFATFVTGHNTLRFVREGHEDFKEITDKFRSLLEWL